MICKETLHYTTGGEKMEMNHNRLRGKIKEVFGTQEFYAKNVGISIVSVSKKLNGESQFKQSEIRKSVELLGIPKEEVWDYFFSQ